MLCKGQIAEPNANEFVFAIARRGIIQLSANFFWNFSHHIRMMCLTLSQYFLTIIRIFRPGLKYILISEWENFCVYTTSKWNNGSTLRVMQLISNISNVKGHKIIISLFFIVEACIRKMKVKRICWLLVILSWSLMNCPKVFGENVTIIVAYGNTVKNYSD